MSILVALAGLATAYFFASGEVFHLAIVLVVLPLGCIWYGDDIGGFVGASADREPGAGDAVGVLIVVAGWVVLLGMLAIIGLPAIGAVR